MARIFTKEEQDFIREAIESKKTILHLRNHLSCGHDTLKKYIDKNLSEIYPNPETIFNRKPRIFTKEEQDFIREAIESKRSISYMCTHLSCGERALKNYIYKNLSDIYQKHEKIHEKEIRIFTKEEQDFIREAIESKKTFIYMLNHLSCGQRTLKKYIDKNLSDLYEKRKKTSTIQEVQNFTERLTCIEMQIKILTEQVRKLCQK